jgi:enoyl-CoA hydratase
MAIHPIELVTASSPTDGVRLITLNRPQKRNALSQDLIRQLLIAILDASHDETVYAIIVTGNGNFFCGTFRTLAQIFGTRLTICSWR